MKMSAFIASANIPASLIRSTVRQIGGWGEFEDRASDIASHGANTGWYGFTYYFDTVAFAKRNRPALLAMLKDAASDYGYEGVISMLCGFQCLKDYSQEEIAAGLYDASSEDRQTVYNALAWYALEEVSRAYVDALENSN